MILFGDTDDVDIYNLSALLTIDIIINQIINILTNYLIKSSVFTKNFCENLFLFYWFIVKCMLY